MRLVVIAAILSVSVMYAVHPSGRLRAEDTTKFKLNSHSFSDGADIPKKYTCDGDDVSPELHWTDQPSAAKSFALIVDDPDAPSGPWVHWVLFDLPGNAHDLPETLTDLLGHTPRRYDDFARETAGLWKA